jgi:hypothetical protein
LIRIGVGDANPYPDPGDRITHKNWKSEKISCSELLDVLFLKAEGVSCSLDVLFGGLGISK